MKNEKNQHPNNAKTGNSDAKNEAKATDCVDKELYDALVAENEKIMAEFDANKKELDSKIKEYDELNDRYLRMMAEYDNFRKRSAKEREGVYTDAVADSLKEILPIIDNLERAEKSEGAEQILSGLKMIMTQAEETLKKLGVESYGEAGEVFDPQIHNAVMHIEDEEHGESEVVEVLQKGYKKGDRIIRHSMVKVAN